MNPSHPIAAHGSVERVGRYELLETLGRGGSGIVRRAVLHGRGGFRKLVALKLLEDDCDALVHEARIGGLLRHTNLVDVYEIGHSQGRSYCAMELCDGPLDVHLPLPPAAVVEVGLAVCSALTYAHEALGLVHLDLKPDNLLLVGGTVKVADLGISRAHGFVGDDRIRGTPGYMAPEQARGDAVDARADIYALGVTLRELATGSRQVADDTVDWAPQSDPDSPTDSGSAPAWLMPLFERCVEVVPADRWPDMTALAEALRALQPAGPGLAEALGLEPGDGPAGGRTPGGRAIVGRQRELTSLADALDRPGVVSVKGPTGIGKSALMAAAATSWRDATGGAVVRCDVAEARTPSDLVYSVASSLGVQLGRGELSTHVSLLGQVLSRRGAALLILDDADRIQDLRSPLDAWRSTAAELRIAVTCRASLDVPDARVVDVGPLDRNASIALLILHARERGAEIEEDPDLRELAERLDGVPLAVELAAGRLGVLSVRDVLERLDLSLLRRASSDRHGTLRAALRWSWDQLTERHRSALSQLSVFSGGFTVAAAQGVLELREGGVIGSIGYLVDQSLVSAEDHGRLRLLASVREFATEMCDDNGVQRRHGAYYAKFGEGEALRSLDLFGGTTRRRALGRDLDNLLGACRSAVARDDGTIAMRTLRAAWAVLALRGPFEVAVELADQVAALPSCSIGARARAERVQGVALSSLGRPDEAHDHLERGLQLARDCGHRGLEGRLLASIGVLQWTEGRLDDAFETLQRALELHREVGDRRFEGGALGNLGAICLRRGAPVKARRLVEEALVVHREMGNRRFEGISLSNLGVMAFNEGASDQARAYYEAAERAHREVGNLRSEGIVLSNLANLYDRVGDRDAALEGYHRALAVHREIGNRRSEGVCLGNIGALLGHSDLGAAESMLRRALAVHREVSNVRSEAATLATLGGVLTRLGRLDEAGATLRTGLELAGQVGDPRIEARLLVRVVRVCIGNADLEGADEPLPRIREVVEQLDEDALRAILLAVEAEVAWAKGDKARARAGLAAALALAPLDDALASSALDEARERIAKAGSTDD